jgi:hypothetical protein
MMRRNSPICIPTGSPFSSVWRAIYASRATFYRLYSSAIRLTSSANRSCGLTLSLQEGFRSSDPFALAEFGFRMTRRFRTRGVHLTICFESATDNNWCGSQSADLPPHGLFRVGEQVPFEHRGWPLYVEGDEATLATPAASHSRCTAHISIPRMVSAR